MALTTARIFEAAAIGLCELDLSAALTLLRNKADADIWIDTDEGLTALAAVVRVVAVNDAGARLAGIARDEIIHAPLLQVLKPGLVGSARDVLHALVSDKTHIHAETSFTTRDGRDVNALMSFYVPKTVEDAKSCVVSFSDISELKSMERQMRAAQRMEAVGLLAGGVAHDFNNMLAVISSYASLALQQIKQDDPLAADLEEILNAATRAAGLTRQLLTFSRKQAGQPAVVNINRVVTEMEKMMTRMLGETITLRTDLAPDLHHTEIDPGQVEQVLMNLAVNARDACAGHGTIAIHSFNEGESVVLAVSDEGCGMDEATRLRAFEPFFTTKEPGKGTGLGLSTVYGIVKQAGGSIDVRSEVGRGTTFEIRLPRTHREPATRPLGGAPRRAHSGGETVLLIEDETGVRNAVARMLKIAGYNVLAAESGNDAMRICQSEPRRIDVVIADKVMPDMGGPEVVARLRELRGNMKALFISGYAADGVGPSVEKPFTADQLLGKLRTLIDAGAS